MKSPEDIWTLRASLQQNNETTPPAGLGQVVAVELLIIGQTVPGRAGIQSYYWLVIREDELSLGAGHSYWMTECHWFRE